MQHTLPDGARRGASRASADTAATAVVVFAVTNVDYIVLSVLFARPDLRFHSRSGQATAS